MDVYLNDHPPQRGSEVYSPYQIQSHNQDMPLTS
jgi:hypothetical protein